MSRHARSYFTIAVATSALVVSAVGSQLAAQTTVVPQSALTASGAYYTDGIGGGIGSIIVTTGGGNANGAGAADGRNDDGFSGPINFGFTFAFFGTNYTSFFANNNGNISFGAGLPDFIPTGPTGVAAPIISAWFSDIDTRGSLSGVMHIRQDIPNELIVTWDQVGYYDSHDDMLNSFQMVIRGTGYTVPVGEGQIGFFYKKMPWEVANTSTTAAIGFGDGLGKAEVLQGSNVAGLNTVVQDHYIWFDQNLNAITTPEPATWALLLAGLGAIGVAARRRRRA